MPEKAVLSFYNNNGVPLMITLMCDGLDQPLVVAGQLKKCQCVGSASSNCRSASSVLLFDLITVWLWHCHTGRSTNFWLHTPPPPPSLLTTPQ